jgi:hypothetical protein
MTPLLACAWCYAHLTRLSDPRGSVGCCQLAIATVGAYGGQLGTATG